MTERIGKKRLSEERRGSESSKSFTANRVGRSKKNRKGNNFRKWR